MSLNTLVTKNSDYFFGSHYHCAYLLTRQHTDDLVIASDPSVATVWQWFDNKEHFLFHALKGCNLIKNADFSQVQANKLSAWRTEVYPPATVGVNFSEKWRLTDGHTAYLYAPSDVFRPELQLVERIPVVENAAFEYRLSGFFGTHRAEGIIKVNFYDAQETLVASKRFAIPDSTKHLGGNLLHNYQYQNWLIQPVAGAVSANLSIILGQPTQQQAPDSFLFIAHVFFGVDDPDTALRWSPYSEGAWQLAQAAQNSAWQYFALSPLPSTQTAPFTIAIAEHQHLVTPALAKIPAYLTTDVSTTAQKLAQLFDAQFYLNHGGHELNNSNTQHVLTHYLQHGWQRNISPSPYFDVTWYRVNNPDVRKNALEPLQHFVELGSPALRSPHPLFDAQWYKKTYLANQTHAKEPFFHYLTEGWRLGYQPHPLFWNRWYEQHYLAAKAGQIDPFYHYLTEGWQQNCNPNPLFDCAYYLKTHGSKMRIEPDPLAHYCHVGWRENLSPHILFDPIYFAMHAGFNLQTAKQSPLQVFLADSHAPSPHPLFDADFYREQVGQGLTQAPLLAYLASGWAAPLDPNPLFSKKYYYHHCKEASANKTDALVHYLQEGWRKKNPVHPLFDADYYVEANPKAKGCIPLQHYLMHGWKNHFSCRPEIDKHDILAQHLPANRRVMAIPADRLLPGADVTVANSRQRIGVFAHIFHTELAEEMLTACNNIPGDCQLFISTNTLIKQHQIAEICQHVAKHPYEIRLTANRGRDLAAMLCDFRDMFAQVDVGVHIHSKRSSHFSADFADAWRRHLIAGNLGSEALVSNILHLLAHDKIGAYAPDHFEPIRPLVQWTGNFATVKALLALCGEDLSKNHSVDFPSGSMFWFKTNALKPLMALHLRTYHFEAEQGQTDNTLAHAIERAFFYFVEIAGYAWLVGKPVNAAAAAQAVRQFNAAPWYLTQQANRIFPSNKDLGSLRKHYSYCTRFLVQPSALEKPRLNLLIPTLHKTYQHCDIGLSLQLFTALRTALGTAFDARIIVTDKSPDFQFYSLNNFHIVSPLDQERENTDVMMDAAQRYCYPVTVRRQDIFIATTWWTALHAKDILQQQLHQWGAAPKAMLYFIQDIEFSYYPWSTQYLLAQQSYQAKEQIIPVFYSQNIKEYFFRQGYFETGYTVAKALSSEFLAALNCALPKEKIVLIYVNRQREKEDLVFLDVLLQTLLEQHSEVWAAWQFIAIGKSLTLHSFKACERVSVVLDTTECQFAHLASRAALGLSLRVSPASSAAILAMASAGVRVLTHTFAELNTHIEHDNIQCFSELDFYTIAERFTLMAKQFEAQPELGKHANTQHSVIDKECAIGAVSQALVAEIHKLCNN